VLALAVPALVVLARGTNDAYPRAGLVDPLARKAAPSWTVPCQADVSYFAGARACQRVRGRLIWAERNDPDGDGDWHLVVVARLRVHVVKVLAEIGLHDLPRLGSAVVATGWTMRGSSGRVEIRAEVLRIGGRTLRRIRPAARGANRIGR
jgi:hypothetical protein